MLTLRKVDLQIKFHMDEAEAGLLGESRPEVRPNYHHLRTKSGFKLGKIFKCDDELER